MAKFILDGQEYGGGSGSRIVKLTQAEYDALPNDKLSDDIIYLIKDSGELTAENLFYDGSETGLGNTVQDAIDEQNKNLSNITNVVLEEQEVGLWYDGEKLYKKIITFNSVTAPINGETTLTSALYDLIDCNETLDNIKYFNGIGKLNGINGSPLITQGTHLQFSVLAGGMASLVFYQGYSSSGTWNISVAFYYTKA